MSQEAEVMCVHRGCVSAAVQMFKAATFEITLAKLEYLGCPSTREELVAYVEGRYEFIIPLA